MKLFILTDCAAEHNYTPKVFKTLEEAKEEMQRLYDEYCGVDDTYQEVDNAEIYDLRAEVVYTDDTYDVLEIFEVEI